jgi:uncharacterized protein (DUF1919 family)
VRAVQGGQHPRRRGLHAQRHPGVAGRAQRIEELGRGGEGVVFRVPFLGGRVYKELKVPYFTPTIGLYFFSSCYIKFVQNLEYYLNQPLNFILTSKYEKANNLRINNPYPIGILNNDVEVHFLHYNTKSDALEKWNRRKDRINYNNLFFSFTDNESCSFDEIQAFDNLDFNKVFFSSKNFESIQSLIWLKQFTASDGIGDIYSNPREYRKYFDAVHWLNSSTNQ